MSERIIFGTDKRQFLGADINITSFPHTTYITGFNLAITLGHPTRNGQVIIIFNDAGVPITMNADILVEGSATNQIILSNQAEIELLYINSEDITERYRDSGGSATGVTLQ